MSVFSKSAVFVDETEKPEAEQNIVVTAWEEQHVLVMSEQVK